MVLHDLRWAMQYDARLQDVTADLSSTVPKNSAGRRLTSVSFVRGEYVEKSVGVYVVVTFN